MKLKSASTTSSNASEIVKPKSSQVSIENTFARRTANEKKTVERDHKFRNNQSSVRHGPAKYSGKRWFQVRVTKSKILYIIDNYN